MRINVIARDREQAVWYRTRTAEAVAGNLAYICPVACALYRHTGAIWAVGVTVADIPATRRRSGRVMIYLPEPVQVYTRRWDARLPVGDLSFNINYENGERVYTPWDHEDEEE